ncbi:hypothetical protein PC9H_004590 [Pleurotus ostreatus]|uniref:DUF6534 domain-containing protein n=3 Tax=Pleurotus TaxID=5320 RepID=A0A067P033_PLEO1|nr:uncharacterized protein PC9H_004590 [Pleurotus ostreatus]KAF7432648.1 hypothetical protein PC9H_004590 [Pleurotus ostreatus]KAG9218611.1 hypothetical protein CCMSSC00406_0001275 [Pleurotus cornucopiae]KAJ8698835.1 hypothetical protein PTI98_005502 [Pleurotus ostreatus]KDQ29747.1 hypothetical protein PLEOSDRAFT_1083332 [Pleurotus ostreatus PC15]
MPFEVMPSVAAMEIGIILSSFLFGIVTLQAFMYFSNYAHDRKRLKILAIVLWVIELGHMICIAHLLYTGTITTYRERPQDMFENPPADIDIAILLSGCSGCIVQAYFADRVRRFTKWLWLAIFLWFLIFITMIGTIVVCVVSFTGGLENFTDNWGWVSTASWILSAVIDSTIACCLSWSLLRHRQSALQLSHRLIDKIILMTISTGMLTSVLDIVTAICFLVMPYKLIYLGLYICIARVYANSFYVSLNARNSLRHNETNVHTNVHTFKFATSNTTGTASSASGLASRDDRGAYALEDFKQGESTTVANPVPDTIATAV